MGQRTWSGCGGIGQRDAHCRASAAASLKKKSVEPEDALHMRKSHLDLLALAA